MVVPFDIEDLLQEHENINFRFNEEQDFPWGHNISGVWYALLMREGVHTKFYGFTSSKTSKQDLIVVLQSLLKENLFHILLGIWTGEHNTHLFLLNSDTAIEEISWRQKLSARELAESETLRERRLERKKLEREAKKVSLVKSKETPKASLDDFNDFAGLLKGLNDDFDEEIP